MALPTFKITGDPTSTWANHVRDVTQGHDVVGTPFSKLSKGTRGFSVNTNAQYRYNPTYAGGIMDWNPTGSYYVGQTVTVYDRVKSSIAQLQTEMTSFYQGSLQVVPGEKFGFPVGTVWAGVYKGLTLYFPIYLPVPGTYKCIANVPSFTDVPNLVKAGFLAGLTFDTVTSQIPTLPVIASKTMRFADVNYVPVWPDKKKTGIAVVDPTNPTRAKGQYWQLISLMPGTKVACDSKGKAITTFTDTQPAPGSTTLNALDTNVLPVIK